MHVDRIVLRAAERRRNPEEDGAHCFTMLEIFFKNETHSSSLEVMTLFRALMKPLD